MTSPATDAAATAAPPARGTITFAGLAKDYGAARIVAGLDLTVAAGEFFTILGPSGCGKTTTLMMLAGFTEPSAGDVRIDGVSVARVPPQDRNIGVVFQNYALFPHMSVADNLAFPLEMRKMAKPEIARRIENALDLVQMREAAHRFPSQLSGGQQQRIAVARAIIFNPPVLLMDEPLGALDRKLRAHLQVELRDLQQRLGVTVIYVTHDQDEAMSMSDRIGIMNGGKLEQVGPPADLYERPASLFVAQFMGDNNMIAGRMGAGPQDFIADGGRRLRGACRAREPAAGSPAHAAVRPERIALSAPGAAAIAASVTDVIFLGGLVEYRVAADGIGPLRVIVQNRGGERRWRRGEAASIGFRDEDVHIFLDAAPV